MPSEYPSSALQGPFAHEQSENTGLQGRPSRRGLRPPWLTPPREAEHRVPQDKVEPLFTGLVSASQLVTTAPAFGKPGACCPLEEGDADKARHAVHTQTDALASREEFGQKAEQRGTQDKPGPDKAPEGRAPEGRAPGPGAGLNELRNMLERFEGDIKKVLHAKRKRFITSTNSSVKTINQKIEHVWKTQEEQRQKLYREYSQQFLTLFLEWDISVQKTKEEEEKLANLCHEQQKIFQQARIVQSRRLKKIKNLYDQFLKSMADFEKDHEHLLTDEQSEVRQGMAMLQDTIVMETQQQELAIVRKSLQSLLF
ncbi:synaptonemal complex protein 3-like [Phacochoerus africanus]|uniref:synaptonemal complex protein 3-like n=1 Tax=Phacochoerus africanus TaxID=41426 RepID=UPI001FD9E4BA|nr:synaptonemal complex protein 3-like [Phacochoerus africanus]